MGPKGARFPGPGILTVPPPPRTQKVLLISSSARHGLGPYRLEKRVASEHTRIACERFVITVFSLSCRDTISPNRRPAWSPRPMSTAPPGPTVASMVSPPTWISTGLRPPLHAAAKPDRASSAKRLRRMGGHDRGPATRWQPIRPGFDRGRRHKPVPRFEFHRHGSDEPTPLDQAVRRQGRGVAARYEAVVLRYR